MTEDPVARSSTTAIEHPGNRLRAQRRQRIRAEIEQAALELFAARGFDSVTIEEIAAASGISRRTFFRYCDTKEELILRGARSRMGDFIAAFEARPDTEPVLTSLRAAAVTSAERQQGQREMLEQISQIVDRSPAVLARELGQTTMHMTSVIETVARRLGVDPRTDLRPALVAMTVLQAMQTAKRTWLHTPGTSYPRLVGEALDIVEGGLAAAVRAQRS